jgi:hypothetical protein
VVHFLDDSCCFLFLTWSLSYPLQSLVELQLVALYLDRPELPYFEEVLVQNRVTDHFCFGIDHGFVSQKTESFHH